MPFGVRRTEKRIDETSFFFFREVGQHERQQFMNVREGEKEGGRRGRYRVSRPSRSPRLCVGASVCTTKIDRIHTSPGCRADRTKAPVCYPSRYRSRPQHRYYSRNPEFPFLTRSNAVRSSNLSNSPRARSAEIFSKNTLDRGGLFDSRVQEISLALSYLAF